MNKLASRQAASMTSKRNNDEAAWESCQSPRIMALDLEDSGKKGLILRELRLFACACCRQISELMTDERSGRAIDVAER